MVALLCKKYKVEFFQLKNIPHNQKECKVFVKKVKKQPMRGNPIGCQT